jgi:hypothetical protein
MVVELDLHNDRPNVHSDVKRHDGTETYLGAAMLTETLHVKDEAEAKAADASEKLLLANVSESM